MLYREYRRGVSRLARAVACAALLAGGPAAAAEDPVPASATGLVSAQSSTGGGEGVSAPSAATERKASAEPVSPSEETRPTGTSGPTFTTGTGTLETRPSLSSEPSSTIRPGAAKDEDIVEEVHESVTYGFLATATWLDSFFGDQRYEAESNESQLRVSADAFREGGTRMAYHKPNYSLRLVLPQLRKKTRLELTGDPTIDPTAIAAATPPVNASPAEEPTTSRHVGTALQYFPVESKRSSFSIRAGLKLNYTKIAALIGPRYRYLIPLDPWDLRLTQEVIWSSDKRWQSRSTIDLERALPGGLFFRTSLEGLWTENVNGFPYALAFTLAQPIDPDRALVYSWINSFQTSPTNELTQELFVVAYRQRFWKPWLFLEIDPQVRFPREYGFAYTPGILFRIEMLIGKSTSLY